MFNLWIWHANGSCATGVDVAEWCTSRAGASEQLSGGWGLTQTGGSGHGLAALWGCPWGILTGLPSWDILMCVSSLLWVCLFIIFIIKIEKEIPRGVFKSRQYFYACWKWGKSQKPPKENEYLSLPVRIQYVQQKAKCSLEGDPYFQVSPHNGVRCPPSSGMDMERPPGPSGQCSMCTWSLPVTARGETGLSQNTGRGIKNQSLHQERKLNTFVK